MAEEIYIARQDTLVDAKTELTEVNTKIGAAANTGGTATAGTLMGKLNALITSLSTHMGRWTAARATKIDTIDTNVNNVKSTASTINTNVTSVKTSVGAATDTGGSATAGTLMGKLNNIISDAATHAAAWTAARAAKLDTINTNAADIKTKVGTASDVGGNTLFGALKDLNKKATGGVETFTVNGSFTVPENVTLISVTAAGGGAGGGNGEHGIYGGGGGGVCIADKTYTVTPGQVIAITIGQGGAGATGGSSGTVATNGRATVIGGLATLAGGLAGPDGKSAVGGSWGAGGRRGEDGCNGVIGVNGAFGAGGRCGFAPSDYLGGGGGGGSYGNGGDGGDGAKSAFYSGGNGEHGSYGGGGGGGGQCGKSSSRGGNGGDGIVIIKWGSAI